jgi:CRP-like cAMP-binding protein
MVEAQIGEPLIQHGVEIRDVYFPNSGVYSVTTQMSDGGLVEVATVGNEGMLGVSVFLGDMLGTGRTMMQVPGGLLPAIGVRRFIEHVALPGPFRSIIARYSQAYLLQIMQCTACNALHHVEPRCCRWLLQTHDRVDTNQLLLKHEFLAVMLGVHRPTVTLVLGALQKKGLIATRYGRIDILDRSGLEALACECYAATREQFARLHIVNPTARTPYATGVTGSSAGPAITPPPGLNREL